MQTCDEPWYDPSTSLEYEVYTEGVGYGTLRRYTLAELAEATLNAEFGFQDLLVLDEAPIDIESVISGAVTGTRQGELSHLNVRSASRGTPNCYVKGAYERVAAYEGQLVKMHCGKRGLEIESATQEEAEAFWNELRPDPVSVPTPNLVDMELRNLLELSSQTADERHQNLIRYGSKGSNLATLYRRIPSELQLDGFVVPFAYYQAFITENQFDQQIEGMLADARFPSDGKHRRATLAGLQTAMRAAACDGQVLDALATQIQSTFGNNTTMVRFRSSSNAEDTLAFNGAGLYESTSVCAADEFDNDLIGPSHCDASQTKERSICRGLKKVWASLWSPKAYEEREWFSIDHSKVAMAILVNTRTAREQANIVAFSGNVLGPDHTQYLINAQTGELPVVSAEPGVWPEKNLLSVDDETGSVTEIIRARLSSEVGEGEHVLEDARLQELGSALWSIVKAYPMDAQVPDGQRVILDTEWKVREDGQLIIKQVRPFSGP
jgi:hypothetical protein